MSKYNMGTMAEYCADRAEFYGTLEAKVGAGCDNAELVCFARNWLRVLAAMSARGFRVDGLTPEQLVLLMFTELPKTGRCAGEESSAADAQDTA